MSLFRDVMDRDSIFGEHNRSMNRMINSFFGGGGFGLGNDFMNPSSSLLPFGGMGSPFGGFGMGMAMNPFARFPDMSQMMNVSDPNSHSFCSTSVMTVTSGSDGRPQVYHASTATRQAPGGVKETRKTLTDTRSGTKKMAVGRHIGERAHIREREDNLFTGQREENEDFVNLEEDEAHQFDQEWRQRAFAGPGHHSRYTNPAITGSSSYNPHPAYNHNHRERGTPQLQIQDRAHRERTGATATHHRGGVVIEELPSDDEVEEIKADPPRVSVTQSRPARSSPSVPRSRRTPTQSTRDPTSRTAATGKGTKRTKRN